MTQAYSLLVVVLKQRLSSYLCTSENQLLSFGLIALCGVKFTRIMHESIPAVPINPEAIVGNFPTMSQCGNSVWENSPLLPRVS